LWKCHKKDNIETQGVIRDFRGNHPQETARIAGEPQTGAPGLFKMKKDPQKTIEYAMIAIA
jgi:hypothetical protein